MKRKSIVALLAMTMAATTLTGCSFELSLGGTPKTAMDVIEKSAEKASDNFHMDGNMTMAVGMDAQGMSLDIPIEIELNADVMGQDMHGEASVSASFMGDSLDEDMEFYATEDKMYQYDSDSDEWTVSDRDDSEGLGMFSAALDADMFENAELTVDKKTKTYTVSLAFEEMLENEDLSDSFDLSGMLSSFDVDEDDVMEAFEDAKVIYVFDKNYNLTSVKLDDVRYEETMKEDGYEADVYVEIGFDFEMSNFGGVTEDDVAVPKKVKKNAIESGSSSSILDFGGNNDGYEPGGKYDIQYDDPDDGDKNDRTDIKPVVSVGSDVLGAYAGVGLTTGPNDWASTFGSDGWEFASDDGEYTFLSCENAKYDYVDLYVYNKTASGTTRADVLNDGFYGYSIDVSSAMEYNKAYPRMSFNGLTWGASADDVLRAFGEPSYEYEGTLYTSYEYEIDRNTTYTLYVYKDGLGLGEVGLSVYN